MIPKNQLSYVSAENELEANKKDPFELDDLIDYAGATILDVGVTLANSLSYVATFGQYGTDWDTGEALHAINEDAGRFYDQNKDLVQLSSFIGGIFVPGYAASRTISWAKQGRTWIGGLERTINVRQYQAGKILKEKGKRTHEFNQARNSMRIATLKSGAAEGLIYELQFSAMMNEHEYLDQDYDLTDFAIGAALGGLVAPLRLIQQTKKLKDLERSILEPQVSKKAFTPPMYLQGEDAGTTLSYSSHLYNNFKLDDAAKSSTEIQGFRQTAEYEHINGISGQIHKMSKGDAELQGRISFTVSKEGDPNPRSFSKEDVWDMDAAEFIGKFAVSDPAALVGVEKFVTYNAELPMRSTIEQVTKEFPDLGKKVAKNEAVMQELLATLSHNEFITHDQLLTKLEPAQRSSAAAIADPFYGQRIISEVDALAGAGINAYPSMKLNQRANMSSKLDMQPYKQSVAMSDKAYHEAIIAVNTLPAKIKNVTLDFASEDSIPFLQALLNKYPDKDAWPVVLSKDSKTTFGQRDEAIKFLWDKKQELVTAGKTAGASPVQIARVANLNIETVEILLSARGTKLAFDPKLPLAQYTTTDQKLYYSQKPIQMEGKIGSYGQIEEFNVSSMLDKDTLTNNHIAVSKDIIDTSGVPQLAEFMNKVLFTPVSRAMEEQLPKALAALENKWNIITSADHAYRELGQMGKWITAYGSDMSIYVNKHIDDIGEAVAPTLSAVAQHPVSRGQFSQLRQALHGRSIEDSIKLTYEPGTRKILTGDEAAPYLKYYGKDEEIELTAEMGRFLSAWLPKQRELLGVHNAKRQLNGLPKSQGAGIWFPYSELNKDLVAYKIPKSGTQGQTEILTARSAKDLAEDVAEEQQKFGHLYDIVTKADSAAWNQVNRYADLEQFKVADISARKRGVTSGAITPGITDIDNFMGSINRQVWSDYRRIGRASNSYLHDQLDFFAQREIAATGGGIGSLAQKVQRKVSLPELVSKTMLNESMLNQAPMLDMANNWTTVAINTVTEKAHTIGREVFGKGKGLEQEFIKLTSEYKTAGIPMPWDSVAEYEKGLKKAGVGDTALHNVQQAQSVLVLLNLRLLEAAHASVTVLSLPVILQGELVSATGKSGLSPLKHMIDAGKFWGGGSAEAVKLKAYAKERKYTQSIVAETTRAMQDFHTKTNIFGKHEKILELLSKPSDFAEGWVREQAFASGYVLAKSQSPNAPMELLAAEAYAFTQRTMGNYVPRQRPTAFQGTFGAMIGLYQTFMLTMGQNMFRYMEAGDAKAMRNLWGAQAGMFGIESLPMYQQFNQLLGGYVSEDHEDFRSTIYKAFGDDSEQSRSAAEHILFGVPSAAFGVGIYTRGTIDPRSPLSITGDGGFAFKPAVFDALNQSVDLVVNLAKATQSPDLGRAILQGFAAQSLWRPGARYAELGLGASFDRKGAVIDPTVDSLPDLILGQADEPFAVMARVIGARPLKEQALRNLRFSNTYYNSIDKDRRAKYTKELRRIVTSEPDPNRIDELFVDFVNEPGGTYRGWKQIYNDAYSASETPYANRLVEDTKRQPTIQRIVDTYAQ